MKAPIGILGAMTVEVEAILTAMDLREVQEHSSMKFHSGTLSGVECVVAQCSVGKVNSALSAQVLADFYHPRAILNIGVAGGVGPQVRIGDVVIARACVEHDCDSSALGYSVGMLDLPGREEPVAELPCDAHLSQMLLEGAEKLYSGVHFGVIASGDQFVADREKGKWLYDTFGALACEMEGGSIAHACLINQIPCAVLRTISDNANDDSKVDFPTFAAQSAQKAQTLLQSVIRSL